MNSPISTILPSTANPARLLLLRRLLLVIALILSLATPVFAAKAKTPKSTAKPAATPAGGPWQIIKVDGHDYLTVDNIATFYGLPGGVAPINKKILLENDKGSLGFTLNSRELLVNGLRNWLCFPVIEKDGKVLVSRLDLAETIEPQLRPNLIPGIGKVRTVVLDPGHGGYDKGACSRFGCEKDYTLDVARQLRPLLQAKGFKVQLTREGDYFVPLEVRARIANAASDAIFVSIHFNAADSNPSATGFEIFSLTPRGAPSTSDDYMKANAQNDQNGTPVDTHSFELSTCVYHSVLGHIAEFDRGIKRARFAVLRLTKVPSILMEGGFMTEKGESRLVANKEWRGRLAGAISVGIDNYRSLADRKEKPLLVMDYHRKGTEPFPVKVELKQSATASSSAAVSSKAVVTAPAPAEGPAPAPVSEAKIIAPDDAATPAAATSDAAAAAPAPLATAAPGPIIELTMPADSPQTAAPSGADAAALEASLAQAPQDLAEPAPAPSATPIDLTGRGIVP